MESVNGGSGSLHAEIKQVTILFADIKDSTQLIDGLSPEEAVDRLEPARTAMSAAIQAYGGEIERWAGDGLMAVFGAPKTNEDHAVAACHAAVALHAALAAQRDPRVRARIGLHSGDAMVRVQRGQTQTAFDVGGGLTLHLASRMEELAAPGSTLLTDRTRRLTEGFAKFRALGPTAVRGVRDPIEVYELLGMTSARSNWDVRSKRELTAFVGRDAEMSLLDRALKQMREGEGQACGIIGEPGTGKSRLVHEFLLSGGTQQYRILETAARPYDLNRAYLPVRNLLRDRFGITPEDTHAGTQVKVRRGVLEIDADLEALVPALLSVLDLPIEDPLWQNMAPTERRRRSLDGVTELVLRDSRRRPLLVIIEDLHWSDAETLAVLNRLLERLDAGSILLVFTARPEFQPAWADKSSYTSIRLNPLGNRPCRDILDQLLGGDASLNELKQRLIEGTGGTPLFIEESVKVLKETGVITGSPDAYRLPGAAAAITIPDSVQSVIAARIDGLSEELKELLQIASVIGTDVPESLLQRLSGIPEQELSRQLQELQAAEFLYQKRLFPEPGYTFKHTLTHDVAYRSLLKRRRRQLHATIVETIEGASELKLRQPLDRFDTQTILRDLDIASERMPEHTEQLAIHAYLGEVWDKALFYASIVGARAIARSANREAVAYFEWALAAAEHLPPSERMSTRAFDLRIALREPLFQLGEIERVFHHLSEAQKVADSFEDPARWCHWCVCRSHILWLSGRNDEAIDMGQKALQHAGQLKADDLMLRSRFQLGLCYLAAGIHDRAITTMEEFVLTTKDRPEYGVFGVDARLSVLGRGYWIRALAEVGEFEQGKRLTDESLDIADKLGNPFSSIFVFLGAGYLYLKDKHYEQAIALLERARQLCDAAEAHLMIPAAASFLGAAYVHSGRMDAALPLLETGVEKGRSVGFMFQQPLRMFHLAQAYAMAARMQEALQLAEQALELASRQKERGSEAYVLWLLGYIHTLGSRHNRDLAQQYFIRAGALARKLGMRPLYQACRSAPTPGMITVSRSG